MKHRGTPQARVSLYSAVLHFELEKIKKTVALLDGGVIWGFTFLLGQKIAFWGFPSQFAMRLRAVFSTSVCNLMIYQGLGMHSWVWFSSNFFPVYAKQLS